MLESWATYGQAFEVDDSAAMQQCYFGVMTGSHKRGTLTIMRQQVSNLHRCVDKTKMKQEFSNLYRCKDKTKNNHPTINQTLSPKTRDTQSWKKPRDSSHHCKSYWIWWAEKENQALLYHHKFESYLIDKDRRSYQPHWSNKIFLISLI